jgi:hypothetical protein
MTMCQSLSRHTICIDVKGIATIDSGQHRQARENRDNHGFKFHLAAATAHDRSGA